MAVRELAVLGVGLSILLQGCSNRYDEERALLYAKMSGVAYCERESIENWTCGDYCEVLPRRRARTCVNDEHASLAFVVKVPTESLTAQIGADVGEEAGGSLCLVGFRGTTNFENWRKNLWFAKTDAPWNCPNCTTHSGMLSIWQGLRPCILESLKAAGCRKGSALAMTGHSLGGALATLAMSSLQRRGWRILEAYTFGSPRVGNSYFASDFDKRFNGTAFRVTYRRDPFVHLPLHWQGFRHINPEIFYNTSQLGDFVQCNQTDRPDDDGRCANQYDWASMNSWYYNDHRHYLGIAITSCPGGSSVMEAEFQELAV